MMTSAPIEAYGGIRIPSETLQQLAVQLKATDAPFHVDHKLSQPLRVRNFSAFVKSRQDGIDELRFKVEIHDEDLHWIRSRPGVSATITAPLERDQNGDGNKSATVRLSADHAWFSDEALIEAEAQLIARGAAQEILQVERAYQFSFVPDPQIFVTVTSSVLLSIGASAIWDGIKMLFLRRRAPRDGDASAPTAINVSITHGERSMKAVVTTNNVEVAHRAIESLDQAVSAFLQNDPNPFPEEKRNSISVWDEENDDWNTTS